MGGHEWFDHSYDGLAKESGRLPAAPIAIALVVTIVVTFAVVWLLAGYAWRTMDDYEVLHQERRTPTGEVDEARATWQADLRDDAKWSDSETLQLPIEDAKLAVIRDYERGI